MALPAWVRRFRRNAKVPLQASLLAAHPTIPRQFRGLRRVLCKPVRTPENPLHVLLACENGQSSTDLHGRMDAFLRERGIRSVAVVQAATYDMAFMKDWSPVCNADIVFYWLMPTRRARADELRANFGSDTLGIPGVLVDPETVLRQIRRYFKLKG
jgi:hypothetical protein